MTEETLSVCAVQQLTGVNLLLGVLWQVLNEVFPRLKKPEATVNVCSGLADAAWRNKGHYVAGS